MSDRMARADDPHVQALITKWVKRWVDGEITRQKAMEGFWREFWDTACMVRDDTKDAQQTAPARQSSEGIWGNQQQTCQGKTNTREHET